MLTSTALQLFGLFAQDRKARPRMMSRERLGLQLLNSFMLNLPFMLGGALAAPQVLLPGRTGLVFDTQTDSAGEEVVE